MFAIRASGKLCSRNLIPGCRLLSIKPHRPAAVESEQEKRKETLRKEFEDNPITAKIKLTWYTASGFKASDKSLLLLTTRLQLIY